MDESCYCRVAVLAAFSGFLWGAQLRLWYVPKTWPEFVLRFILLALASYRVSEGETRWFGVDSASLKEWDAQETEELIRAIVLAAFMVASVVGITWA